MAKKTDTGKPAVPSTDALPQNEILEVEIIIPEEVLKSENTFKDNYNFGKLQYNLGNEVPKNVKDQIVSVINSSKPNELVQLNPVIIALEKLQSFKDVKYDPEKKNEKEYTEMNKQIGSFNSSVKAVTDIMKKDAQNYIKSVNELKTYLETEAKTARENIQLNFKPYLDEKARKQKEAQDKKNQELIEANLKLTEENKRQAENLKNQKKQSQILVIQGEIGKISFSATNGIAVLNLDGLEKLKKEVESKDIQLLLPENDILEFGFTDDEIFDLKVQFDNAISTSLSALNLAISNFKTNAENTALKNENEVMKAKDPNSFLTSENDNPFSQDSFPAISPNQSNADALTDSDKIQVFIKELEHFQNQINITCENLSAIKFNDNGLQTIQKKVTEGSFDTIKEWGEKLVTWTKEKEKLYITHLTKQQS